MLCDSWNVQYRDWHQGLHCCGYYHRSWRGSRSKRRCMWLFIVFFFSPIDSDLVAFIDLYIWDCRSRSRPQHFTQKMVQTSPSLPRWSQRPNHSRVWFHGIPCFVDGSKGAVIQTLLLLFHSCWTYHKIFVRAFDSDERLVGVAFMDVGVYVTSLRTLKNLLLVGDAVKSVMFVAFQVRFFN